MAKLKAATILRIWPVPLGKFSADIKLADEVVSILLTSINHHSVYSYEEIARYSQLRHFEIVEAYLNLVGTTLGLALFANRKFCHS